MTHDGAPTTPAPSPQQHDTALDLLRAYALICFITWSVLEISPMKWWGEMLLSGVSSTVLTLTAGYSLAAAAATHSRLYTIQRGIAVAIALIAIGLIGQHAGSYDQSLLLSSIGLGIAAFSLIKPNSWLGAAIIVLFALPLLLDWLSYYTSGGQTDAYEMGGDALFLLGPLGILIGILYFRTAPNKLWWIPTALGIGIHLWRRHLLPLPDYGTIYVGSDIYPWLPEALRPFSGTPFDLIATLCWAIALIHITITLSRAIHRKAPQPTSTTRTLTTLTYPLTSLGHHLLTVVAINSVFLVALLTFAPAAEEPEQAPHDDGAETALFDDPQAQAVREKILAEFADDAAHFTSLEQLVGRADDVSGTLTYLYSPEMLDMTFTTINEQDLIDAGLINPETPDTPPIDSDSPIYNNSPIKIPGGNILYLIAMELIILATASSLWRRWRNQGPVEKIILRIARTT
ncbi:hypothetical protein [Corynebacterium aquilae]|uniref:Uncharacterized protein n=1 Tax=Corynebacterium aquilae DSM 44791 TaxID=1431546 RepID=A0A1L7CHW9_9CORY|nr:hypothetical protein [Corynebacterium aquilae]APT85456.1 hypothetical protein CAQU_10790 [Corynebacterium aquilae DSM 44791]